MHQEALSCDDIGRALLGLEPGQPEIDSETLFIRTVSAFETINEPIEAVDLLIATITCLSAQPPQEGQNDKFRAMAQTLTAIWTKKTFIHA